MPNVFRVTVVHVFEIAGAQNQAVAEQVAAANVSHTGLSQTMLKALTVSAIELTPEILAKEEAARRDGILSLRHGGKPQ